MVIAVDEDYGFSGGGWVTDPDGSRRPVLPVRNVRPNRRVFVNPTLAEDRDLWLAEQRCNNTAKAYRGDWLDMHSWCDANCADITQLDTGTLKRWQHWLTGPCELTNSTANRKIAAIRSWHNWLTANRQAKPLTGRHRPLPTSALSETRWLTPRETVMLMTATHTEPPNTQALIWLLMHGLRRAEALNSRWGHIRNRGNYQTIHIVGKGGHTRTLRLANDAIPILTAAAAPHPANPERHIIRRKDNTPHPLGWANDTLNRISEKAGIERITPHVCRHTFAVTMLHMGADIRHIQRALGHKDLRTTETYLHDLETWSRSPIDDIARMWLNPDIEPTQPDGTPLQP